jgi:uncharacterized RDD family membrane protein YckC
MEDYFVVVNGKPQGPYPFEKLRELDISSGTFVKTALMDDYKEAHEIPELRNLLGIKAQVRKPQYFASLDIRLLAIIIDYFFVFIIYCILATIVVLFIGEKQLRIIAALAGLAIVPLVKMIYSIIMEASSRQATYGKLLMGIKVTDENGLAISFSRSLVRNLSKLICVASLGIGYAFGFFNKRQQCIHDRIAGTLVIKDRLI